MHARIIYILEHLHYGEDDDRTGWWIVRLTAAVNGSIVDRKPVAKFTERWKVEQASQARDFKDYLDAGYPVLGDGTDALQRIMEFK